MTEIFHLDLSEVTLVSGGSAWADHVAVRLWLDSILSDDGNTYSGLLLYLPCELQTMTNNKAQFEVSSTASWMNNPGITLNKLHSQFSEKLGQDSMNDLLCARELGAIYDTRAHGFHNRNLMVAQSDYLIAFTWGDSTVEPKEGGTLHTWSNCKSRFKIHVPLSQYA